MTASNFAKTIDKFAATTVTAMLLATLPLAAVGFFAGSF